MLAHLGYYLRATPDGTTARTTAPIYVAFSARCESCKDSQTLQTAARRNISASPDAPPTQHKLAGHYPHLSRVIGDILHG